MPWSCLGPPEESVELSFQGIRGRIRPLDTPTLVQSCLRSSNSPQSCVDKGASGSICPWEALGRERKTFLSLEAAR